jgi:hypothetical protein
MCDMMAGFNDAVMKERIAKVCKSTPKYPYNKFNINNSVIALIEHASSWHE